MKWFEDFANTIFQITPDRFNDSAVALFQQQVNKNPVYRAYNELIGIEPSKVTSIDNIPFLPIELFKSHDVYLETLPQPEEIFYSSGTTGQTASHHMIYDLSLYEKSCLQGFERVYGPPSDYCIIALLPSYLERGNSSLVYMAGLLIRMSGHPSSGYYLNDYQELAQTLTALKKERQPILLLGVSFALWELAEQYPMDLSGAIIMETGGMKGRRKELVRDELHQIISHAFNVETIHSEYGMTELLSQAYATAEGIFQPPPWMKALTRDPYDPFSLQSPGASGGINMIDLANIHSCAFIQTDDLGRTYSDGSFEVLGRFDQSEVRGCNLMV